MEFYSADIEMLMSGWNTLYYRGAATWICCSSKKQTGNGAQEIWFGLETEFGLASRPGPHSTKVSTAQCSFALDLIVAHQGALEVFSIDSRRALSTSQSQVCVSSSPSRFLMMSITRMNLASFPLRL
jgi:hypothetical protein